MCAGKLVPAVTQTMCPPHGRSRVFSCLWHHPVLVLGLGRLVLPAPGGLSSLAVVPRPDRAVAWCSMQVPVQVPEMQQALSANLRLAGAQTTVTVMVTTRAGWNTRSGCIHGWRWVRACVRAWVYASLFVPCSCSAVQCRAAVTLDMGRSVQDSPGRRGAHFAGTDRS